MYVKNPLKYDPLNPFDDKLYIIDIMPKPMSMYKYVEFLETPEGHNHVEDFVEKYRRLKFFPLHGVKEYHTLAKHKMIQFAHQILSIKKDKTVFIKPSRPFLSENTYEDVNKYHDDVHNYEIWKPIFSHEFKAYNGDAVIKIINKTKDYFLNLMEVNNLEDLFTQYPNKLEFNPEKHFYLMYND